MRLEISTGVRRRGFTIIEVMVVLAILATLTMLIAPRYIRSLTLARESALRENLTVMRYAVEQHLGDKGIAPVSLEGLVETRYLRQIPQDPVLQRSDAWVVIRANQNDAASGIVDVRSGAPGVASDGSRFADW